MPKTIEWAFNGAGAATRRGSDWVGQLLGGGALLAYNGWRVACDSPNENACDLGEAALTLRNERIVRISAGRRAVVKRGAQARAR